MNKSKVEEIVDKVYYKNKWMLPILARLLLISPFLEDGIRMFFQWDGNVRYINKTWHCGGLIATLFVVICIFGQIGAGILLMAQKHVRAACSMLAFVAFIQVVGYDVATDPDFLPRFVSLFGGVFLLVAETFIQEKSAFSGVPDISRNVPKEYFLLAGRLLFLAMFATILQLDWGLVSIIENVIGLTFIVLISLGYKTKLCSAVLILWVALLNVYNNAFWNLPSTYPFLDYTRSVFFQNLSVIGGLLMLIRLGPGELSIDEKKKDL